MEKLTCKKGCCTLQINPYISNNKNFYRSNRRKAGVFIYDPGTDKVLLVQSRGHLWGLPKGTVHYGETERKCAIREVEEETGLIISENNFSRATMIRNRALYFYSEKKVCNVKVQDHIKNNDVNALGWIKPDCLEQCIVDGHIILNQHCRIVFQRFMKRIFSHSTFILVERKHQKKTES